MKECMYCGFSYEPIIISLRDANGVRHMCPNCIAAKVSEGIIKFTPIEELVDDITGIPGAVEFTSGSEHYILAPKAMLRLLAHNLQPNEWLALSKKYDPCNYMLHDDFYDEDGNAWQPTCTDYVYIWKDIVKINGVCYAEAFEISGEMDNPDCYQIDDFLEAVAHKHGVDVDDIETYTMDDIEIDPAEMPWGAEGCGCYINGVAEWCIEAAE